MKLILDLVNTLTVLCLVQSVNVRITPMSVAATDLVLSETKCTTNAWLVIMQWKGCDENVYFKQIPLNYLYTILQHHIEGDKLHFTNQVWNMPTWTWTWTKLHKRRALCTEIEVGCLKWTMIGNPSDICITNDTVSHNNNNVIAQNVITLIIAFC